MDRELREMFDVKGVDVAMPPTLSPQLRKQVRRQRIAMGALAAAAAVAVVAGGLAGARSLMSEEAVPPAQNESPLVDTWTTTDVEGRTRTLVIRPSSERDYAITIQNHLAQVCSGASSTVRGTGRLVDSTLVVTSPEITCDDGTEPKVEDDLPPAEELLGVLEFEHDPRSDILTQYSPLEHRRTGSDDQAVYNGLTLVWARADAESRLGDLTGWVTYGDKDGIWGRGLANTGEPADRVGLASTPGTPLAWSDDGSKLLVELEDGQLLVVNAAGGASQLTDVRSTGGGDLSPDGSTVVYATTRECFWAETCKEEEVPSAIYQVDAEGGTPRVLVAADIPRSLDRPGASGETRYETMVQEPRWSPDGSQIAYFEGMGDWGNHLRVVNGDGTGSRVVVDHTTRGDVAGAGHVRGLAWSPDGDRLAFSIEGRLYVVGVDGSDLRLVSDRGVRPYWSPDGSHIAYTTLDGETLQGGSLEIVRLDDLRVQNLGYGTSGPWTSELQW